MYFVTSQGCTEAFKKHLVKVQQQWIRGKVFGLSPNGDVYPQWFPGIWNSVCITASSEADTEDRININGRIVLKTEFGHFLNTSKTGFEVSQNDNLYK